MCGITGFLATDRAHSGDALKAIAANMAHAIRHRGPDAAGAWADPSCGIALGHRRLSIIDLSAMGAQPMRSPAGRFVMAFNGEIYNYAELRKELESRGLVSSWRSSSDTEVALAAFDAFGIEDGLRRLTGMFAIALWDCATRTLCLARDRLGEKPLYYGWSGGAFVFASELKALRAHPNWHGEVDRDALCSFLRHSYVPAPRSIYRGISKLLPGSYILVSADRLHAGDSPKPRHYWRLSDSLHLPARVSPNDEEATVELEALLKDAVGRQMVADVPLGAFLSGGVDSSTIVALMQAQSARPVKTFTIGFHEDGYNEAPHAKAVARHLGTEHHELYVTPQETIETIPLLPALFDEPFADSSQIPTYLVSKLARQHVTVSLSGDAGDELFCGYNRYSWGSRIMNGRRGMPAALRRVLSAGCRRIPAHIVDATYDIIRPALPSRLRLNNVSVKLQKLADVLAAESASAVYRQLVSHWTRPEELVLGGRERAPSFDALSGAPSDFVPWMMYLDAHTYLPDDILVKVDRAAMSVSLESRVPLLDHKVVEFVWSLPMRMKLRNGSSKWLLREVLYRHVPKELIERPKMGFGIPIDRWLRGPLRDWAEELLAAPRLAREGFFDPEPIRRTWLEHLSGRRSWAYHLWDVLMFQAWLEHSERGRVSESERTAYAA
jgi:asparagine synthase (glutamine-hydrolysing)